MTEVIVQMRNCVCVTETEREGKRERSFLLRMTLSKL